MPIDRFRLLGSVGFVSDDTEQTALVAQSMCRHPNDLNLCVRDFRRALLGWFLRLPWGIGLATLRACLRIAVGRKRSGVMSAGNGSAMRSGIIGVFFAFDPAERTRWVQALSEVTHVHPMATAAAQVVARVSAGCANTTDYNSDLDPSDWLKTCSDSSLQAALQSAVQLAESAAPTLDVAERLGTSGYVLHTVPFALFCLLRFHREPMEALQEAISAGGDTDTIAAILGGWLGALHGESGLPLALVERINNGPFGPRHLRLLGAALASAQAGQPVEPPKYSPIAAMARNLALYPVIIAHGLLRLLRR